MKFICDREVLSQACLNVQRAVSVKTSIPAVECISLKAQNNSLTLTGYDLEFGIYTTIGARVEEDGGILINARILTDILKNLPGDTVKIESDERHLANIESGDSKYSITGLAPEEYPELPSVTGGLPVTMVQGVLKEMVRQTIYAAAVTDTSKVIHTGLKFEISNKLLTIVAVDGFRLAVRREPIDYEGEDLSFVVPAKTMSEAVKLFFDESQNVSIGLGKRHIVFEIGDYFVVSRLLEGDFLNYKSTLPTSKSTSVLVNTRSLIGSIERTSLIIADRLTSPIRCYFNEDIIHISSSTAIGTANDKIGAKIEGSPVEIGFNNKFLLDALKVADTDEVIVERNGPVSPIIIKPTQGDSFTFLILPVRLKGETN